MSEHQFKTGDAVVYRPFGGEPEDGTVIEVRGKYVMVLYKGDRTAKATRPEDLEPLLWRGDKQ